MECSLTASEWVYREAAILGTTSALRGWPDVGSVTADGEPRSGLIVGADTLDHGCRRLVHADDIDRDAMVAELQDNPVKSVDRRDVPEVCRLQVDDHALQRFLAEVEGGVEGFRRGEENLSGHPVGPHVALATGRPDGEELRDLVRWIGNLPKSKSATLSLEGIKKTNSMVFIFEVTLGSFYRIMGIPGVSLICENQNVSFNYILRPNRRTPRISAGLALRNLNPNVSTDENTKP